MPGACSAGGDRISDRPAPKCNQFRQRGAGPGRLRHFHEGTAQCCCFKMAFTGWRKCRRELGNLDHGCRVVATNSTMDLAEKNAVVNTGAAIEHASKPSPQRFGAGDVASLDRPLDTA